MNAPTCPHWKLILACAAWGTPVALLVGCKGVPTYGERQARGELQAVAAIVRPQGQRPELPVLSTNTGLSNFLQYAMLNQPKVQAAYFDWAASVERITVERSLPDPRLTFQMDIRRVVESVMPGLMMDFPGPGKLAARAEVASSEGMARYFAFESAVLQTAYDFKQAYYRLHFLEDKIRLSRENLTLLVDLEEIARVRNESGKATLQDVLRAQIGRDRATTEIANLEDSRDPLRAQFKAALGVHTGQPDPPLPRYFESTPAHVPSDQLLTSALLRNPRLRAMEAELRMADAGIRLARKSKVPDFAAGLEVDVKTLPAMFRPKADMTLPIWRDKIAAEIAAAQARRSAAEARLSSEQILLAVDFADKLFTYRESGRNLELLQEKLIPKARQSLEVARAAYLSGQIDFFNLLDTERTLIEFQLTEVEARMQRELVQAEISLLIAGLPPAGAPTLNQASLLPVSPLQPPTPSHEK